MAIRGQYFQRALEFLSDFVVAMGWHQARLRDDPLGGCGAGEHAHPADLSHPAAPVLQIDRRLHRAYGGPVLRLRVHHGLPALFQRTVARIAAGRRFYALVHWFHRPARFTLFCSGIAIGTSIWCKVQAIPVAGVLSLAIVWIVFRTKVLSSGRARLAHAGAYLAGALLPAVLILAAVAQAGALKDFWYSYVLANLGMPAMNPS